MIYRCEKVFCAKHRIPEIHNCDYDYKSNGKRKLEEDNNSIAFKKF
jgi:predicted nucleic acid binding AN1-type Zn finger protein